MYNNLYKKVITIYGITFKKNTNDVRGSSAVYYFLNYKKINFFFSN